MAKFDLSEALETLDYDFSPHGTPRKSGPHGIVPEPSTGQIEAFTRIMRALVGPMMADQEAAQNMTPTEIAAKLADVDEDEAEAREKIDALTQAIADLCSGQPSAEDIKSLPFRGRQAFFGWVVGTFLDPNQQALVSR